MRTLQLEIAKKIGELNDHQELLQFQKDLAELSDMALSKASEISNSVTDNAKLRDNDNSLTISASVFSAADNELILPPSEVDAAFRKKSALEENEALKYPTLKSEYIEKGKLTNSACRDFAQWLCVVDGGAVTKKRLEASLTNWKTKTNTHPALNLSTVGGWINRWKDAGYISSAHNKPGLYTMTKIQLVKAIGNETEKGYNLIFRDVNFKKQP